MQLVEKVFHIAGGGGNKLDLVMPKFAIYDTRGKCWLGTAEGVKTWDDYDVARMAATVVTEQMGVRHGGYRAMPYDGSAKKYKDEVKTEMTPLEAIQKIDGFCDWPKK